MLLEYAQRPFERMEHRLSNLRGVASIQRILDDYALASDVGLHFGNVTVGLVKTIANHRNRKIAQRALATHPLELSFGPNIRISNWQGSVSRLFCRRQPLTQSAGQP